MSKTLTYSFADDTKPLVASGEAAELNFPVAPPSAWFQKRDYKKAEGVTITAEGQIYGYVAVFGVNHIGYDKVSRTAPKTNCDYAFFQQGSVITAEKETVKTGVITAATQHAGYQADATQAAAHYDNTGYGLADVVAYDDDIGIQIAGALRPDVTLAQARALRASAFSPDWRPMKQKARFAKKLEMVAIMACNLSGFLVNSLVASGNLAEVLNVDESDPSINPGDVCVVLDEDGDVSLMCGPAWAFATEEKDISEHLSDENDNIEETTEVAEEVEEAPETFDVDPVQLLEDRVAFLENALRRVLAEEILAEALA